MNNTLIPQQQPAPLATRQPASAPALDFSQIGPEIMARAAAIAADVMANGGTINPAQALAAAYHFEQTGEVIGRHAYVGTTGQVAGKVLEGYRGVARELDMSRYQFRYRPLTDEEKELHGIGPNLQALACEVDVLKARAACIRMGVPYQPIIGVGILSPKDKTTASGQPKDPPKTKTWYWVLQKRARVDALRQLGENTSAEDVLDEAGVEAPAGSLSVEQAEALLQAKRAEAEAAARPDAEAVARSRANVLAMRGDPNDDPYNDPLPPPVAPTDPRAALIARLRTQAAQDSRPATDLLIRQAFGHLACLCGSDDTKRHALLREVFGLESSKDLTTGQANVLIAWIAAKPTTRNAETGKGENFVPTGAALVASEYSLLFPPDPALFDESD